MNDLGEIHDFFYTEDFLAAKTCVYVSKVR